MPERPKHPDRFHPGELVIVLDMDGIIADISKPYLDYVCGERSEYDWRAWAANNAHEYRVDRWPEVVEIGLQEWVVECFTKPEIFAKAALVPGAKEALLKWRTMGHHIFVLTARPKDTLGSTTLEWLKTQGLDKLVEAVFMAPSAAVLADVASGGREDFKGGALEVLMADIFVEDHGPTLKRVSFPMMAKVCLSYPYNENEDLGLQGVFAKDWDNLSEIVEEASRWHYWIFGVLMSQK